QLPISVVPQAQSLLKQQQFSYRELKATERWKQASQALQRLIDAHS
ncbi:beta-N-acetylhexosaminidase, partial [Vibrio diabolicus]|nr:beta-N-acetylhexosaminidase [Vibrio diabolicus]